ncbi:hypothetical protein TNCV_2449111 [Trichonephila clavipes]|uniref:Uncharacterized protein n=1 Tax=Trichonephila clavipes TaxID=2585209 RepID=A0A8X6SK59_TRICX|nr:hypothetical protein TNCV_2449111 [Trichonephila clavipes]
MYLSLEVERPGLRRSFQIGGLEGASECGYGDCFGDIRCDRNFSDGQGNGLGLECHEFFNRPLKIRRVGSSALNLSRAQWPFIGRVWNLGEGGPVRENAMANAFWVFVRNNISKRWNTTENDVSKNQSSADSAIKLPNTSILNSNAADITEYLLAVPNNIIRNIL